MAASTMETDVLVIGGGIAGLAAALAARERVAHVCLVAKGQIGAQTASHYAAGQLALNLPRDPNQDPADWVADSPLTDPLVAGRLAAEVLPAIRRLETYGVPVTPAGGGFRIGKSRTHYGSGGATVTAAMARAGRRVGIEMVPRFTVLGLLAPEQHCAGAFGIGEDGEPQFIQARSVVVAAGGGGRIFARNSHPQGITGDGYTLLLQAGAQLANMEFIRFFPTNLRDGQFPPHRPSRSFYDLEGLRVVNADGEDIFQKHLGQTLEEAMEVTYPRFVTMSWIVVKEQAQGDVFLDLTQVPERIWNTLTAMSTRELIDKWDGSPGVWKQLLSMRRAPITARAMSFHGGALVGPDMDTSVPGLFAGGEVADLFFDVSANPPCELGPLPLALTSGHIAGTTAGQAAAATERTQVPAAYLRDCAARLDQLADASGDVDPATVYTQIGALMTRGCGPLRSETSLRAALADLEEVEAKLSRLRRGADGLLDAYEARSMALVARTVVSAALMREESRAEHYRKDYPARDDKRWATKLVARLGRNDTVVVEPRQRAASIV